VTWEVKCPKCGTFDQIQKGEPVLCPQCGSPDIDTEPVDGDRPDDQAHTGKG
jgi:Zn finger protein HypA/HybF involved in hydrogenase expression